MNRCLLCEARSYVYNMANCAGCIARNIQRMPERFRQEALAKQTPDIRAAIAKLRNKAAA